MASTSSSEDPRLVKAHALYEQGVSPVEVGRDVWMVQSEREPETSYEVENVEGGGMWVCSCPDFAYRGFACKHILLVKISLKTCENCKCARNLNSPHRYCRREKSYFEPSHTCSAFREKLSNAKEVTAPG